MAITQTIKKEINRSRYERLQELKPVIPPPRTMLGAWVALNKQGYFTSNWGGNGKKAWSPTIEQWAWMEWILQQKGHFMFMGARKMGKTEILTIFQCVWLILNDLTYQILIITGTDERGKYLVSNIRSMLVALHAPLKGDAETFIFTTKNRGKTPNLRYKGIGSTMKGDHVDLIIIDDPLDEKDCYSALKKRQVELVVNEATSMCDRLLMIGQYIADDDIFCKFRDKIPTLTAWVDQYPHLVKMTRERYLIGNTLRSWGLNYEGKIYADDEALFTNVQVTDDIPTQTIYAMIDPAFGGKDRTAMAIGGLNDYGELIATLFSWQASWELVIDQIAQKIKNYSVNYTYYEDSKNKFIGKLLAEQEIVSSPHTSRGDKRVRIQRLKGYVGTGRMKIYSATDEVSLGLFRAYTPLSAHDDVPDAAEMLAQKAFKY